MTNQTDPEACNETIFLTRRGQRLLVIFVAEVGITGSAKTLSKAQKQFNKMIAKIEAQMREIEQWRQFLPLHQQRIVNEYQPLQLRLREQRIALVHLLDSHMEGKGLARTQREKLHDILVEMLEDLLSQEESTELIALFSD